MEMDMIMNTFASGVILFFAGFALLFMLFQILAFYIAGRVTGSIDDEVTSAFTLFGALLIISTASTLVNAAINLFMPDTLIPPIVAFVFFLVLVLYAIAKIYELSIGKSILYFLLSLVIIAVLGGGSIYLGSRFLPESSLELGMPEDMDFEIDFEMDMDEDMEMEEEADLGSLDPMNLMDDVEVLEESLDEAEENLEGAMEEVEEAMEGATEEDEGMMEEETPSGPSLPGSSG